LLREAWRRPVGVGGGEDLWPVRMLTANVGTAADTRQPDNSWRKPGAGHDPMLKWKEGRSEGGLRCPEPGGTSES
jgi:hypothetical protein